MCYAAHYVLVPEVRRAIIVVNGREQVAKVTVSTRPVHYKVVGDVRPLRHCCRRSICSTLKGVRRSVPCVYWPAQWDVYGSLH